MISSIVFHLKSGKAAALREWGNLLMTTHKDEAIETLIEENVINEALYVIGDDLVLGVQTLAGELRPTNLERELNQKHRAVLRDCLTKIEGPTPELKGEVECLYFLEVPQQEATG